MAKGKGPFKPVGYEFGYSRPPETHRLQAGQSGNPSGRPKGATNKPAKRLLKLQDILLHEAYRTVTVNDRDGPLKLSVVQAAMRSLALKAAQGHVGAQKLFLESLAHVEAENAHQTSQIIQAFYQYKQRVSSIIKQRQARGIAIDEDEFIPHPDHIIINMRNMEVSIKGPIGHEDKRIWDELWQKKRL